MRHSPPEVVHSAAEAVADVNAVRLPPQPVERCVVAAQVCAEGELAHLCFGVVRVVDAHVGSA